MLLCRLCVNTVGLIECVNSSMVRYCAVSTTGSVTGLNKSQMSTNVNMQLTALITIITTRLHSDRWIWMWKGICRIDRLRGLHDVKFTSHARLDDVLCLIETDPLTFSMPGAVAIHILTENVSDLSLCSADWIDLLCCLSRFWAYLQLFEWFLHHVIAPSTTSWAEAFNSYFLKRKSHSITQV